MTALYGDGRTRCACGHLDVVHAFNTAGTERTACSHVEGAQGTPCGCPRFTPEETP